VDAVGVDSSAVGPWVKVAVMAQQQGDAIFLFLETIPAGRSLHGASPYNHYCLNSKTSSIMIQVNFFSSV